MHLLDVFLNDYDVAVMNPPYGYTTDIAKVYLRKAYPNTSNDLYAAFVERGFDLCAKDGLVGALTSRSFMFLPTFQRFREHVLLVRKVVTLAELGLGILDDATVRTSAYVLLNSMRGKRQFRSTIFFGLRSESDRHGALLKGLEALHQGKWDPTVFIRQQHRFESIPKSTLAFWLSESLLGKFQSLPPLDADVVGRKSSKVADVKVGLQTGDDERFVRCFWEVNTSTEQIRLKWVPFSKGGMYSPYYGDLDLVVLWLDNGRAIKNLTDSDGHQKSRPQNEAFYFRRGLTYPADLGKGYGRPTSSRGSDSQRQRLWYFPCQARKLRISLGYTQQPTG